MFNTKGFQTQEILFNYTFPYLKMYSSHWNDFVTHSKLEVNIESEKWGLF